MKSDLLVPVELMQAVVALLREDPEKIPARPYNSEDNAILAYNRMVGRLMHYLHPKLKAVAINSFIGHGWTSLYEMYYFVIDTNSCDPLWRDPLLPRMGNDPSEGTPS